MTRYETASQKCPQCGMPFRVMADECGTHECPHCNFQPEESEATIRCSNCGEEFEDEGDLMFMEDELGEFLGCPRCETDEYLMDLD